MKGENDMVNLGGHFPTNSTLHFVKVVMVAMLPEIELELGGKPGESSFVSSGFTHNKSLI